MLVISLGPNWSQTCLRHTRTISVSEDIYDRSCDHIFGRRSTTSTRPATTDGTRPPWPYDPERRISHRILLSYCIPSHCTAYTASHFHHVPSHCWTLLGYSEQLPSCLIFLLRIDWEYCFLVHASRNELIGGCFFSRPMRLLDCSDCFMFRILSCFHMFSWHFSIVQQ